MRNPYHPLTPPDDPTLFYGRLDATAFLRQRLVGGNNQDIGVILGRQGMGKTALLHHVQFVVDERYQTVLLDTASITPLTISSLLNQLVENTLAMMDRIGASTYRVPVMPQGSDADLQRWFADDFLDVVLTAIRRDRFLLLLIDDWQTLYQAVEAGTLPADFTGYWAGLLAQHDRLDILTTLDITYEFQALGDAPTANVNGYFRLGHFDEATARQLITEPVAESYDFSEEAIQEVLRLCGGYPFLLHSVCRLIYRYREGSSGLTTITPPVVESVYMAALDETGEVLQGFWEGIGSNARVTLEAMLDVHQESSLEPISLDALKARVPLNPTQLVSRLRELEYSAIIKNVDEGLYVFSTALEADWLVEHRRAASTPASRGYLSSPRLLGLAGVIVVFLVIGALFALGMFDSDDEAPPAENAPPTSTFVVDMEATHRAETQTATARPSATMTEAPEPTEEPTETAIPFIEATEALFEDATESPVFTEATEEPTEEATDEP